MPLAHQDQRAARFEESIYMLQVCGIKSRFVGLRTSEAAVINDEFVLGQLARSKPGLLGNIDLPAGFAEQVRGNGSVEGGIAFDDERRPR